jgi:uncharacterized protein
MSRLLLGAVLLATLLATMAALEAPGVRAQSLTPSPTPRTGIPTPPHALPVIGGGLFPSGEFTVVQAAAIDRPDYVNYLIEAGSDPDSVDKDGRTGLIYAAMSNDSEIAQTLITHGAKLNPRDKLGYTALHWAAQRGSIAIMKLLLAAKALVDPANDQGVTPLMLAASNGNANAVRLLLQNHADPAKADYSGRDAIGWAGNRTAVLELLKNAAAH